MEWAAMALHRLNQITVGVPDADATGRYNTEVCFTPLGDETESSEASFRTSDDRKQLRPVQSGHRPLIEFRTGANDPDDIDRIAAAPTRLDTASTCLYNWSPAPESLADLMTAGHGGHR
jgi:hypothetical protein